MTVLPYMTDAFKAHGLTRTYGKHGEAYQGFRMGRESSSMFSVYLHFSPLGMFIQGDWSPPGVDQAGFAAREHKGMGWFLADMTEDYCASKFFEETFVAERAVAEIREWIADADQRGLEPSDVESLQGIVAGILADRYDGAMELMDGFRDEGRRVAGLVDDGVPGMGIDPASAGWLWAMRARFLMLYAAMMEPAATEGFVTGLIRCPVCEKVFPAARRDGRVTVPDHFGPDDAECGGIGMGP